MRNNALSAALFLSLVEVVACASPPRKWGGASTAANANASHATAPASSAETSSAVMSTSCEQARCIVVCDKTGDGEACIEAATALRDGAGVSTDFARAASFFGKACKKQVRRACHELAKAYSVGEGVAPDAKQAVSLYGDACDMGVGQACEDLAKLHEKGQGVAQDHAKAIELMARGCAAEDFQVWTCTSLRKAADKKDTIALRALSEWKKACAKKDATACRGVERTSVKTAAKK